LAEGDRDDGWRTDGYAGSYDAVRRYAGRWAKQYGQATAAAYVPLSFAPGEAYQFDWSHEIVLLSGVTVIVKVAHVRLCYSRMLFVRSYPRETQESLLQVRTGRFVRHIKFGERRGRNKIAGRVYSAVLADVFTFKWADVGAAWSAFEGEFAAHGRELANNYAADIKQAIGEIRTALYGDEAAPAQKSGLPQVPAMNVNASLGATEMQSHYQALITQIDGFYNRQKEELSAAVAQHRMSYDQETAALLRALEARHAGEDAAYDAEIAAVKAAGKNYEAVVKEKLAADQKYALEHRKIVDEAATKETKEWQKTWQGALSTIESSFNSQLRGLLAGTTTWNMAWKKMLGDMVIKFIEMCEQMVVKWAAAQLAQTTATVTGAAARTAAENSASAAGVLGMLGNAIKAIVADAGQAFAGVFAFLAPTMGPAAAAPAASAQASVLAAVPSLDVGTDYVTRGGFAFIHAGERITPARTSGPYSGAGTGATVHAPVNISLSALDAQSVRRFFNDNSHHMLRAINDAVKRGAHLGPRSARA
jgi:hypothetical protein